MRRLLRAFLPISFRLWLRRAPAILRWLLLPAPLRIREALPHVIAERRSPLRRSQAVYAEHVQRAKEHNVARVASLLDGVAIAPGAELSWHTVVGPPLESRGFREGPELRGEALDSGVGGGACQASNLLFWLAVHAGLTIVERHRHSLDLFPDDGRDVPFGCGATVLYPTRDLRLKNPHAFTVVLRFAVEAGALAGAIEADVLPLHTYRLVEQDARVEDNWRKNRLERHTLDGAHRVVHVETLCENTGRICYGDTDDRVARTTVAVG